MLRLELRLCIGEENIRIYSEQISVWHSPRMLTKASDSQPPPSIAVSPVAPKDSGQFTSTTTTTTTANTEDVFDDFVANNSDSPSSTSNTFERTAPFTSPQSKTDQHPSSTPIGASHHLHNASLDKIGEIIEEKLENKFASFLVSNSPFFLF